MYNDCFGFSESPFQIIPNSKFFYQNPSYEDIIATVQLGVETRKGIIVVTGEPGTGKTLLLKLLASTLGPNIKTVVVQNPDIDLNGLLRLLLERLNLSTVNDTNTVMFERLREFLIEQRENSQIVSLFVDEAQDLDKKTLDDLRILSNLEFENEALLPIVLMGQSELNAKLDDPSELRLKQRVVLTRKIYPLIRREIAFYVAHRLHKAHYEGNGLFDPDAIQKIANISKGIPRTINVICDNALLKAYSLNQGIVSPEIIDQVAHELRLTQSATRERHYSQSEFASQTARRGPLAENAKSTVPPPPASQLKIPLAEVVEAANQDGTAVNPEITDSGTLQQLVVPEDLQNYTNDDALTILDCNNDPDSSKFAEASAGFSADRRQGGAFRKFSPRRVSVAVVIALILLGIGGVHYKWQLPELFLTASIGEQPPPRDDFPPSWPEPHQLAKGNNEINGSFVALALPKPVNSDAEHVTIADYRPNNHKKNDLKIVPRDANGEKQVSIDFQPQPLGAAILRRDQKSPVSEAPAIQTDSTNISAAQSPQSAESRRKEAVDAPARNGNAIKPSKSMLEVVGASMLRDKPSHKSMITGTLEPGTRVRLLAKTRDYYYVSSLQDKSIRGYVHREDAFFKPI
ncbi:MAG: AAA family ATPase, partial [Deltaproteobacteria bacterium]|nr:AAA family ATPase [Deltaproteobacteria bacterium]